VGLLFAADAAVRTAEACDHMQQQQQRREKHMAGESIPPRQEGKLSRECLISILPRLISRTRQ
jgi:hypothetical protein